MKFFRLSPIVMLLTVSFAWAQYPKDEIVDPYPKSIKELRLLNRLTFDDAEASSWKALHQAALSTSDTGLRIESSGTDPYVQLPELGPSGAGDFEIRIRMKNGMNPKAEFFWATEASPHFTGENAVRFGFFKDPERSATYRVRFKTDSPLTRLRFDPGTSEGVCTILWVELYKIEFDENAQEQSPRIDLSWANFVERWKTISSGNLEVRFDEKGTGAQIQLGKKTVGEIYPLAHTNPKLPLGGVPNIPVMPDAPPSDQVDESSFFRDGPLHLTLLESSENTIVFSVGMPEFSFTVLGRDSVVEKTIPPRVFARLEFELKDGELRFRWTGTEDAIPAFGPVFRPAGTMQQALLCGVEYLEKGEHSSATADLETPEHLRHAPKETDITWPFMAIVTERIGFGLLWDDPQTQAVFATPDVILGDSLGHYMGLYGNRFSGTLTVKENNDRRSCEQMTDLEELILGALRRHGLPELPKRPRDDEQQRLLNLAAFERSILCGSEGWQHAATPGVEKQFFPMSYGNDFVSSIWQLSGRLPDVPRLDHGGGHLRNPASFFLMRKADEFLAWTRNESRHLRDRQKEDGSFRYSGKYLKGHWDDTASGHCGNALYRLMYNYRILGDRETLQAALKGLEFANRFSTPRGAQVWELSLHTPDIMGSSRLCMANVWAFEATGERKFLDAARRWAVTGLPFVYFRSSPAIKVVPEGSPETIMRYATIPVFGATDFQAPNWIGLPVQWCGLDYGEALFLLAPHDDSFEWRKIAEGILLAAEQMQYPDGNSVGLLPDSLTLETQGRNPHDINPSVLVMQRRRLQGKIDGVDVALSEDGHFRVVSPYRTTIKTDADGKSVAVIEAEAGTTYQILVNGSDIRTITSKGTDTVPR